jgi:hypothetical protein
MDEGLIPKPDHELTAAVNFGVPAVVLGAGKNAALRFIEFFAAEIRNPNTRRAYHDGQRKRREAIVVEVQEIRQANSKSARFSGTAVNVLCPRSSMRSRLRRPILSEIEVRSLSARTSFSRLIILRHKER